MTNTQNDQKDQNQGGGVHTHLGPLETAGGVFAVRPLRSRENHGHDATPGIGSSLQRCGRVAGEANTSSAAGVTYRMELVAMPGENTPHRRLARLLKVALRRFGFRCVGYRQIDQSSPVTDKAASKRPPRGKAKSVIDNTYNGAAMDVQSVAPQTGESA
jgi:hypothetical protein